MTTVQEENKPETTMPSFEETTAAVDFDTKKVTTFPPKEETTRLPIDDEIDDIISKANFTTVLPEEQTTEADFKPGTTVAAVDKDREC